MRLNPEQIISIKKHILAFDANAKKYLYGSRVDDSKRGGDIDLLILSNKIDFDTRRQIKLKLYDDLGEQKIDLLVKNNTDEPFTKMILTEGILL